MTLVLVMSGAAILFESATVRATSDGLVPAALTISIRVVRTGATAASVLGVTDGIGDTIDVLVNGQVAASGTVSWIGEYWLLNVPVSDGASVQSRIGSTVSPTVTVPAYVPQPVGPPGFIYAHGSDLMRDGTPIQLFGVDEQTVFLYALIASGLWGTADPGAWGKNQLFPSGPEAQITNVSDADSLFQKYFQYFLHYNQVAGTPTNPKVNLLRVWVSDDSWYPEGTYIAWKNDPTTFWNIFDKMVYWANRSGVYLVPVLGHFATNKDNRFFDPADIRFTHQVEVVQAIMDHYDSNPTIAMWDLWNEPDVDNDVYWASVGGITGFTAWASTYIADVKPHTLHHLITIGMGGWTLFPGVPNFGWEYHFFFNDIPGLDVSHHHTYDTTEDQYLIDWERDWERALGIPHYEGEVGYNAYPGPSPLGYGYWPWYSQTARADGMPAMSTMVFLDNGRGVYTDYPYTGGLPEYPPENPGANAPPHAAFNFLPMSPQAGVLVQFNGSASTDDHGIVRYQWDFGDGRTSEGVAVSHAYTASGTYSAVLTVTDANGSTGSAGAAITVTPASPGGVPPTVTSAAWDSQYSRVLLTFSTSMDRASVGGKLSVQPNSAHALVWDTDSRLSVVFTDLALIPETYTVTVLSGAMDGGGRAMTDGFAFAFRPAAASAPLPSFWGISMDLVWWIAVAGLAAGLIATAVALRRARSRLRTLSQAASRVARRVNESR